MHKLSWCKEIWKQRWEFGKWFQKSDEIHVPFINYLQLESSQKQQGTIPNWLGNFSLNTEDDKKFTLAD